MPEPRTITGEWPLAPPAQCPYGAGPCPKVEVVNNRIEVLEEVVSHVDKSLTKLKAWIAGAIFASTAFGSIIGWLINHGGK